MDEFEFDPRKSRTNRDKHGIDSIDAQSLWEAPNLIEVRARTVDEPRWQRRVNVDFPVWMIEALDDEAARLGVTRQSIIKVWLAERLEQSANRQT
ncbi:type II toxin-antitoxin system BrnA family antitoxin [Litorivivens lipolytica]|uniref:type II toxin-antitoxin system BrnA family antitoxin n=1 Tax=Litorivivens lipolytica TaxID=1524264 RepID=UPI003CCCDB1A